MRKRSAGRKSSESPGKGRPRGVERATLGGVGLRIAVGSSEADLKRRSAEKENLTLTNKSRKRMSVPNTAGKYTKIYAAV